MSWINDLGTLVQQTGVDKKTGEIVDKIGSAVNTLALKLGVAAEHVYTIFTKQVIVESITNVFIYISLLLLMLVGSIAGKKFHNKAEWTPGGDPSNSQAIGFIISCIAVGVFIVIFLCCFFSTIDDTVTGFVNPEYKVIKEIAELIKEQATSK